MLPDARIVDCRRDLVETFRSCYRPLFRHGPPEAHDFASLPAYARSVPPCDGYLCDLASAPCIRIQRHDALHDLGGLPFDAACLDSHHQARLIATASASRVRKSLRNLPASTAHFAVGTHSADICVNSNGRSERLAAVPVSFDVTSQADDDTIFTDRFDGNRRLDESGRRRAT